MNGHDQLFKGVKFVIISLALAGALPQITSLGAEWKWAQVASTGPTPRAEYGFAYDIARGRATLFGGSNNLAFTGVNDQTWSWQGTSWAMNSEEGPAQRCDQAMAYDSIRNVIVMFGGYNGSYLGDTWEWNGTTWSEITVSGPPNRADSFMSFDSGRGVMVLFGGQSSTGTILSDTWEFDGNTWNMRTNSGPQPRWIQRMAYDSGRSVTVMFGGRGTINVRSDTWEWDGNTWMQKSPATSPPARYGNGMAFDSQHGLVVLYGGQANFAFGSGPLGDTWGWDGMNWVQLSSSGPPARTFTKIAYDASRGRMVMFGGYNGSQFVNDTWELVGPPPIPAASTWGIVVLISSIMLMGIWISRNRGRVRTATSTVYFDPAIN